HGLRARCLLEVSGRDFVGRKPHGCGVQPVGDFEFAPPGIQQTLDGGQELNHVGHVQLDAVVNELR
ncbi:MAG: hypothetical protein ACK55I_46985, partial [bacterium]